MLGHDDVSEHVEAVPTADILQCPLECQLRSIAIEQRQPTVATEGDEVIGSVVLIPLEMGRHVSSLTPKFAIECDVHLRIRAASHPTLTPKEG